MPSKKSSVGVDIDGSHVLNQILYRKLSQVSAHFVQILIEAGSKTSLRK